MPADPPDTLHRGNHLLSSSDPDANDRLRQLDAIAAVGRVASSLSHALGTPLNVIAGRANLLALVSNGDPDVKKNTAIIQEQVKQVTDLIGNVLSFARSSWPNSSPTSLRTLLERAITLGSPFTNGHGIELQLGEVQDAEVQVPNDRVLHVLMTLLALTTRSANSGARFVLDAAVSDLDPPAKERGRVSAGRFARFGLAGPFNVGDDVIEHVYEPWLVSDGSTRETITQLALAFGVTREHRGWLHATRDGEEQRFDAHFPQGKASA